MRRVMRDGSRFSRVCSAASLTMIPVVRSLSPGSRLRSSTQTRNPRCAAASAQAAPAKLAPTTTTSKWESESVRLASMGGVVAAGAASIRMGCAAWMAAA